MVAGVLVANRRRKKGERSEKVAALVGQKVQASSSSIWLGSWGLIWCLLKERRGGKGLCLVFRVAIEARGRRSVSSTLARERRVSLKLSTRPSSGLSK